MSIRHLVFASCTAALLSGCAFLSSSEAEVEPEEEIVADEDVASTNDAVGVAVSDLPLVVTNKTATSLLVSDWPSLNFDKRTLPVTLVVLHYTAAPLKESLRALSDGRSTARVSSHYLVAESGTIYRLVAETNRAWHAGVSNWKGVTDINSASIGIEMVNLGYDKEGRPRPYAVEQVESVTRLCLDIQSRYGITDVVGHSDVAPTRKIDPGELFPWRMLYDRGVKVATKGFIPQGE